MKKSVHKMECADPENVDELSDELLETALPLDSLLQTPELVTFYNNLSNRVLWLDTEVDESWLEYLRHIVLWNADDANVPVEDRIPIKLMFFSNGGSADVMWSLADVVSLSKTPVVGINMGVAQSAACTVYMMCHHRLTLPNASFLIHKGSIEGLNGTVEQVISYADEARRNTSRMLKIIFDNSKISQEVLEHNMSKDWFISAQEAIEYGIADGYVQSIDDIM